MDFKSPKSEPAKSFDKPNFEKAEKQEVALKPDDKPKPKNKIEHPKIDIDKEPKNKIQREKIDLNTPAKNKIERPKIDLHKEPINKIQREKIDLNTPARNKIERIHTSEPKSSVKPEGTKLSLVQIKEEMKKINWNSISKNWTVNSYGNNIIPVNPYANPSKENPLYKHKEWLQTVYNHKNWNFSDNGLRIISGVSNTTIYKWRKKFEIPTKQKLFKDGAQKECGRCHQIKPIDEYGTRMDNRKLTPFSRCKKCRIDINQIYKFKNKVKIIQNVYNGKLKGKCQSCSADVRKLPSLEFHHLDPKLKSGKTISLSRNWEKTKKQVEREKATILCENCHTKQRSKHYNNYEKIINENNLNPSASNDQISKYVDNKLLNIDYDIRRQVSRNIKKKIIIDHLYDGKCVGCGEISTKTNLPALQFHHRDKNNSYKMSKTYVNLRNLESKEIIKKLKEDNCIPLCGNCHRMEQATQFKNNYEKIVSSDYWDDIKKNYYKMENNIKDFKFKSK